MPSSGGGLCLMSRENALVQARYVGLVPALQPAMRIQCRLHAGVHPAVISTHPRRLQPVSRKSRAQQLGQGNTGNGGRPLLAILALSISFRAGQKQHGNGTHRRFEHAAVAHPEKTTDAATGRDKLAFRSDKCAANGQVVVPAATAFLSREHSGGS